MTHRHIPHSAEWFEAVTRDDPEAAVRTANMLAAEGRDDICGECGFDPAFDFELQGTERADSSIPTIRLCEVCAIIRRGLGERWTPMAP